MIWLALDRYVWARLRRRHRPPIIFIHVTTLPPDRTVTRGPLDPPPVSRSRWN